MGERQIRVLLVEDNALDADVIREAIAEAKDSRFVLERVDCLSGALERLARGGIDLVLADLGLPDSDGLETVAKILARTGGAPIIVLTASDDENLAVQALQQGAQDYLVKGYIQVYRNLLIRSMRYALERHRAEQELIRLASFPEQNPDPIIEADAMGAITYVNPAARRQFPGLTSIEHPVLRGLGEVVAELQREGSRALSREVEHNGCVYEQHISYYAESHLIRCYCLDITRRKQTEGEASAAALEEKKRALEIDRAYQELKRAQAMLVQAEKMAAVGQLASGIAHEVKNPLGIILQCVDYLEPELGSKGGRYAEILQVMREAVHSSDKVIRGLLDFSKPAPLELKLVPIGAVIDASVALVQTQSAGKRIRIEQSVAQDVPFLMLDENQMKQVLINLILNAFHAMPQGGRLIFRSYLKTLSEPGNRIGVRKSDLFRPGQTVLICEVEDTGTGIPKAILPEVFNPFFTTKPPGEGVGIGLAITAAIIEGHRGMIHIESEEGKGTRVVITLPIPEGPHGAA